MSAPEINVRHIAQLARIYLSEEEISTFQNQLSQVLAYVETLQKLDVSQVEATAYANPVYNVFRDDEPRDLFTAEQALANAPRQANDLFVVAQSVEKDATE